MHDVSKYNDRTVHCKGKKKITRQLHSPSRELILNEAEAYQSAATWGKALLRTGQSSAQVTGPQAVGAISLTEKGASCAAGARGPFPERSGHAPPGACREGPGACGAVRNGGVGRLRRARRRAGALRRGRGRSADGGRAGCQPQVRHR